MLAISIGVREAARQLNLNEDTVCSWAKRYDWFAPVQRPPSQAIDIASTASNTPGNALATEMQTLGSKSKLALAKANLRAAEHYEKQKGRVVAKDASNFKSIVQAGSTLHAWEAKEAGSSFSLNVLNYGTCGIEIRDKTSLEPGVNSE